VCTHFFAPRARILFFSFILGGLSERVYLVRFISSRLDSLLLLREVLFYVLRCHAFSPSGISPFWRPPIHLATHTHVQRADITTRVQRVRRPAPLLSRYPRLALDPRPPAAAPFQPPVCLVRMDKLLGVHSASRVIGHSGKTTGPLSEYFHTRAIQMWPL